MVLRIVSLSPNRMKRVAAVPSYLRGWRRKTSDGLRPVKNVELWQELDRLTEQHDVSFERVKGHSGHAMNERCDELAVQAYLTLTGRPPRK